MASRIFDIAIIGTGPAGLVAALAVAAKGMDVALIGPRPRHDPKRPDTRTIALFEPSVELLGNVGAWAACAPQATPLKAIRIIDDTGSLFRAPEILFDASDIGRDVFGFNIPNIDLIGALFERAGQKDNLTFVETAAVVEIEISSDDVRMVLKDGSAHKTRLLAAADGRNSICRKAAGIEVDRWDYPQTALVCNFEHSLPHDNISTEFHRTSGPFTTVPMAGDTSVGTSANTSAGTSAGHMSSLVWIETPDEANRLKALSDAGYMAEMENRLQGLLGNVISIGPRAAFPLSGMTAKCFAQNRVALIGEAAHVVPPIGAQGLNLSFRDGAYLADCVSGENGDPGGQAVMDAYNDARRLDVSSRAWGIDLLNRALISKHYPMQLMRGLGLHMLSNLPTLKHAAMREGMKTGDELPSLMRRGE